MAGFELKCNVLHDDFWHARRCRAGAFNGQPLHWWLQLHRHRLYRRRRQQLVQPLPTLSRVDKAFPVRNGEIDRRQCTGAEDRSGDDDACAGLLLDDEISAHRKHDGLQQHPENLGDCAEATAEVTRLLLAVHVLPVRLIPSCGNAASHSHGDERLSIASARFRETVAHDGSLRRRLGGRAHEDLGEQRQRDQDDRAGERRKSDERMECKADCEIQRDPGQIEERHRAKARKIGADGIEIAQRLHAVILTADAQWNSYERVVDAATERLVECAADPDKNSAPDCVEHPEGREQHRNENQQTDQRRHAAARQHAVVDFEHEHGAREHENIAHATDQRGAVKGTAARGKRLREF